MAISLAMLDQLHFLISHVGVEKLYSPNSGSKWGHEKLSARVV